MRAVTDVKAGGEVFNCYGKFKLALKTPKIRIVKFVNGTILPLSFLHPLSMEVNSITKFCSHRSKPLI